MTAKAPPPTPAAHLLGFAVRQYKIATKLDSIWADPLFRRRLRLPNMGRDVYVELMPNLVLRVRDQRSGQILAQSQSGQIDQLDPVQTVDFDARADRMAEDEAP